MSGLNDRILSNYVAEMLVDVVPIAMIYAMALRNKIFVLFLSRKIFVSSMN